MVVSANRAPAALPRLQNMQHQTIRDLETESAEEHKDGNLIRRSDGMIMRRGQDGFWYVVRHGLTADPPFRPGATWTTPVQS